MSILVRHHARRLHTQRRTWHDDRGGDRVDKLDLLARVVRARADQEPLVARHAFGAVLVAEVFIRRQSIRLILLHHRELGDATAQHLARVEWKWVLGEADLFVGVFELVLAVLVSCDFLILK